MEPGSSRSPNEERILVLTPSGSDGAVTSQLLRANQFHPVVCRNLEELTACWDQGAGVLLLAEEAISNRGIQALLKSISSQAPWSDIPIIILTGGGDIGQTRLATLNIFAPAGNVTFLERPFRKLTLLSMLQVALKARKRQYQLRETLDSLRKGEERLRLALNAGKIGVWEWDIFPNKFLWSERIYEFFGLAAGEFGESLESFAALIHPEDTPKVIEAMKSALGKGSDFEIEFRIRKPGGEARWLYTRAQVAYPDESRQARMVGAVLDISERKQAEHDFQKTRESLLQSQKMEAIGKLAGGIAHDFNNMLTAINGYSEMLLPQVRDLPIVEEGLEEILKSGKRAASLTQQLLAYSRQQIMAFQTLDLNSAVMNMGGLLKRLIQEDIETSYHLEPDLPCIIADPSQMEQIILNLAINARDALPKGGKIRISTSRLHLDRMDPLRYPNIEAGAYVRLTISDDGMGMDEKTKARIFEPFFTTKEQGKGTGMGLSTVYGIVKQSSGHILVESKVYCGSTFTVLFPAASGAAAETKHSSPAPSHADLPRKTLLVVEDEQSVRQYLQLLLESQGFKVLAAGNGAEAVQVEAGYREEIHLLLTDIVMPDCNGRELAGRLMRLRPRMKVLLMSGHTEDAILNHGGRDGGHFFLHKPFSTSTLMEKLCVVLQSSGPAGEMPDFRPVNHAWQAPPMSTSRPGAEA